MATYTMPRTDWAGGFARLGAGLAGVGQVIDQELKAKKVRQLKENFNQTKRQWFNQIAAKIDNPNMLNDISTHLGYIDDFDEFAEKTTKFESEFDFYEKNKDSLKGKLPPIFGTKTDYTEKMQPVIEQSQLKGYRDFAQTPREDPDERQRMEATGQAGPIPPTRPSSQQLQTRAFDLSPNVRKQVDPIIEQAKQREQQELAERQLGVAQQQQYGQAGTQAVLGETPGQPISKPAQQYLETLPESPEAVQRQEMKRRQDQADLDAKLALARKRARQAAQTKGKGVKYSEISQVDDDIRMIRKGSRQLLEKIPKLREELEFMDKKTNPVAYREIENQIADIEDEIKRYDFEEKALRKLRTNIDVAGGYKQGMATAAEQQVYEEDPSTQQYRERQHRTSAAGGPVQMPDLGGGGGSYQSAAPGGGGTAPSGRTFNLTPGGFGGGTGEQILLLNSNDPEDFEKYKKLPVGAKWRNATTGQILTKSG